ncbi:hypothetical protein LCM10_14795 [Rossellomorea aquimaris]|uniref:hypothetical protein n=1 Tax=Rossellomorea aquimaris TaxID=189382 RepID=UPI001CD59A72|nr:hypothetical protein [Rossellomorea aquimaris]MCA1056266.1 hypothetical protein [Rossellomorea aquimaris]
MNAFKGLLKKDFKTSKVWFFGWIGIILLIYVLALIVAEVTGEGTIPVVFIFMLGACHVAVIPVIVVSMLRLEGKTQLWLHSPQSGMVLLFPKIIVAFLYSTLSFVLVDVLGMISLSRLPQGAFFSYWPVKEGILFNLGITVVALYFTVWTIFLWTFYHALAKFPSIKHIRWLLVAGIIIAYQSMTSLFMSFKWAQDLFSSFTIDIPAGILFSVGQGSAEFGFQSEMIPFPVLAFILEGLLMAGLFVVSCWLLDRKVEV